MTRLFNIAFEHSSRRRIELFLKSRIACVRHRDERAIERPVGADRAWLVLAGEIHRQPRHQAFRILGIGGEHLDDIRDRDGLVDPDTSNPNPSLA